MASKKYYTPLARMAKMIIQQSNKHKLKRHSGAPKPSSMLGLFFKTSLLY